MTRNIEIKTVRELIDWKAGTLPDAAFLISPETGLVSSFKDLQDRVRHLGSRFQELGLERGDKIAFLMDNGRFTAELFLGAMYGASCRCRSTHAQACLNCRTCWIIVTRRSRLWGVGTTL